MRICNACGEIFRSDTYSTYCESYGNCPKIECHGHLIDIDENLYEAYIELNDKGYTTRYCCSGHSYESYPVTYISFYGSFSFSYLPNGFSCSTNYLEDEDDFITTISKGYGCDLTSIELQKQIWKTVKDVLKWAEKLDICDED